MTRAECLKAIQEYQNGALDQAQREELFSALLADEDLYNGFAQDQIVSEVLFDPSFADKARHAVEDIRRRRMWGWKFVPARAIAVLFLALIGGSFASWKYRQRETSVRLKAESAIVQTNQPEVASVVPKTTPGAPTPPKPATAPDSRAAATIFAVRLYPVDRDQFSGNTFPIHPEVKAILFEFPLPLGQTQNLTVSISHVAGETVGTFKTRVARKERQLMEARVPASLLRPGDYMLTVVSSSKEVDNYSFTVLRNNH